MRCDLCKGHVDVGKMLCDSCAEAIRRLVRITKVSLNEPEGPKRVLVAQGVAAAP